jgi:CRISPR/Cas system-associated exonuclease Cas4 (RecB family)
VLNEAGIIVPNSHQYRPDRVIMNDRHAIVIDYKFGWKEKDDYVLQVKEYMQCLKNMNFEKVEGFVWYVSLNKHIKIVA